MRLPLVGRPAYLSLIRSYLARCSLDTLGNVFSAAFWEIVKGMGQVSVVPCGSLTADGVQTLQYYGLTRNPDSKASHGPLRGPPHDGIPLLEIPFSVDYIDPAVSSEIHRRAHPPARFIPFESALAVSR